VETKTVGAPGAVLTDQTLEMLLQSISAPSAYVSQVADTFQRVMSVYSAIVSAPSTGARPATAINGFSTSANL
jgi:hypothetical protein